MLSRIAQAKRNNDLVTTTSKRRRGPQDDGAELDDDLLCVVMSSHSTGLETWHALIRSRCVHFTVDAIVHVDSHPDMVSLALFRN